MNFEIAPRDKWLAETPYDQGAMYCATLTHDNKYDWRLPTKEELNEIYKSRNDFFSSCYWSSKCSDGYGWNQDMFNGFEDWTVASYGGYYVRAVRDIK